MRYSPQPEGRHAGRPPSSTREGLGVDAGRGGGGIFHGLTATVFTSPGGRRSAVHRSSENVTRGALGLEALEEASALLGAPAAGSFVGRDSVSSRVAARRPPCCCLWRRRVRSLSSSMALSSHSGSWPSAPRPSSCVMPPWLGPRLTRARSMAVPARVASGPLPSFDGAVGDWEREDDCEVVPGCSAGALFDAATRRRSACASRSTS